MKNLMIFVNPSKSFSEGGFGDEANVLVKIQVENSLRLGWRPEDIMLVTNFRYEYAGIKALEVGDDVYCRFAPTATKIYTIIRLFRKGIIGDGLYWFHDLDAFQLQPMFEEEIGLPKEFIGVTDYGRSSINPGRDLRWSTGTIFFREDTLDIFMLWASQMELYKSNEEIALLEMLKKGKYRHIKDRVKRMNITWNLATRKRKVEEAWALADKPLRVIHFHPFDDRPIYGTDCANIEFCLYGRNGLGHPLVTPGLAEVMGRHGIS